MSENASDSLLKKISPFFLLAIAWGVLLGGIFKVFYPFVELKNVVLVLAFVSSILSVLCVRIWEWRFQKKGNL